MKQKTLTFEEDEYIKNNFGNKTYGDMAEHIVFEITTTKNRVQFLGFEVKKKAVRKCNEEATKEKEEATIDEQGPQLSLKRGKRI